ncbi:MAG: hypothetical protein M1819_000512 [Sarea resinae]|nr:MAG: hypothetical protein M1819_000512 [Sarea resinae]
MADKVMSKLLGSRRKRENPDARAPNDDAPEANIGRNIRLFCESGGPDNQDEEVLYLPAIVDAAESSPAAQKEAATVIRKCLKDNPSKAHVRYNAIMLIRILADHPGKAFTRNIDAKFVATIKEILKDPKDANVQQILQETLESFEVSKPDDETLTGLREMWKKEKLKAKNRAGVQRLAQSQPMAPVPRTLNAPPYDPNSANYFARRHRARAGLPHPDELASRIEEARTSAKLLTQVLQSTPTTEILASDILKEFAERCQSASKSIHGYIGADDPPPDDDTMLTLIETNELLSVAVSKYQRGVLQARKALGSQSASPSPSPSSLVNGQEQGQVPASAAPLPRLPQRTNGTTTTSKNPFLKNPFLDASASSQAEHPLASPPSAAHPQQQQQEQEPLPWDYSDPPSASLPAQPPLQPVIRPEVEYSPPSLPPPGHQQQQPPLQPPSQTQAPPHPPQLTTSTPSYIHRQDSAIDHVNMHGASVPSAVAPVGEGREGEAGAEGIYEDRLLGDDVNVNSGSRVSGGGGGGDGQAEAQRVQEAWGHSQGQTQGQAQGRPVYRY